MKAAILTLCLASLARGQVPPDRADVTASPQRLTVQVHGAPAELTILAERDGQPPIELPDNGAAVREGWFEALPSRSVQLRLLQHGERGDTELWSGMAMLTDRSHEQLAFSYQNDGQRARAIRVPASPPLQLSAGAEPAGAARLALGWAGLVLAWLGILVLGWAIRGRSQGAP